MPRQKDARPRRQPNQENEPDSGHASSSTYQSAAAARPRRSFSEDQRSSSGATRSGAGVSRRSRSEERRPRTQIRALREIAHLQRSTNLLIPKLPFARLIREVLMSYNDHALRVTPEALMALQESAELYIVQLMEDAYRCTIHRNRVTLMPKDINLALYIRERW
ncbi:histone H3-6-like [Toxorhynchites rutilus septentrionalis]|uniref:histone H3-6-like n=1 Tax=Toxorhynchites rutilus septentrionalis TaxID=329112 RepID=UPI0024786316|nr:histone H3-6-like [Toxorhynchites rutilus septentrionalis]